MLSFGLVVLLTLGNLIGQLNTSSCPFQFTCFPSNPLDVFSIYNKIYGIPDVVVLGIVLGLVEAAIYVKNRSLTMLAILGIYTITIMGASYWSQATTGTEFNLVQYIIAFAVGTAALIMVLKLLRE